MNPLHLPSLLALTRAALAALLALSSPSRAQDAASTFGHARTRQAAELGRLPTPLDVAVADIVNYHRHRLPIPRAGQAVALDLRTGAPAVRPGGEVYLQIGFTTAPPTDRNDQPPLNLALVIDTSGSMRDAGKLDDVQAGLERLAERLRPEDRVALVSYANAPQRIAASQVFGDGRWFREAIRELRAGGSTDLHGGLMMGLEEVSRSLLPRGSNRVLLLTDGIANVGETDPSRILAAAKTFTAEGVDLTTIGVGQNLNTQLLDGLARGGRGLFHFVADAKDLAKVFIDEVDMLLTPVARQATVRLTIPRGLLLEQVYGHEWQTLPDADPIDNRHAETGTTIEIPLPDMNAGLTAVIILRCRVHRSTSHKPERSLAMDVVLDASAATTDAPIRERASVAVRIDPDAGDPLLDVAVRKNQTIAMLAQGMHDMAEEAADGRWVAADRCLRRALTVARERYPHRDDPDVTAVLEMAEAHAVTVSRYVDRFDHD